MSNKVQCPACGKLIANKGIPKHTNGCPKWAEVIGIPPSEFNFDKHFKRRLWSDDSLLGTDYTTCLLCPPDEIRLKRLSDHLKVVHDGMTKEDYQKLFPDAPTIATSVLAARQKTVMERYGVDNVSKAPEIQIRLRDNNRANDPEVKQKRHRTNLKRYGHENPLGGVKGAKRARAGMLRKYGVENPQQVPEIREKTLATTEARYGDQYFFRTDAFKVKFQETSQERFGTDHPMQSDKGKELFTQGYIEKYGVEHHFLVPTIQQQAYATNLLNHGGKHSQQCPEVLKKARKTWIQKHGVDNPAKVEAVKIKIKDTWTRKHGVPFPPQSLWINQDHQFPNQLEQFVQTLLPDNIIYSGDGSYWIRASGQSRSRNPDFVVLTAEQAQAYRDGLSLNEIRVCKVIEVFGDYWHGPKVRGKSRIEHEQEVLDYYSKLNIKCLILWENDIRKNTENVKKRINLFLNKISGRQDSTA